jgi:sugar lactone lactonase YvrE
MGGRQIRCVAATADVCGEGVVWHPGEQAVFWTDINRRLLHRWTAADVGSRNIETWEFDQPVTSTALTEDPARILIVLGGRVILWDIHRQRCDAVLFELAEWPRVRCNDARVSPNGTLWLGTMQNNVRSDGGGTPVTEHVGQLLSLDAKGEARVWHDGLGIANTIAWSSEGDHMYFGDTLKNALYVCDFDPAVNAIANRRIFDDEFARGLPDGSAVDEEGCLWNCRYGGGCIVRFRPDGSVGEVIETPMENPTNCAFGGSDGRTLYVTSASGSDTVGRGALFAMKTEVAGLAGTPFRL